MLALWILNYIPKTFVFCVAIHTLILLMKVLLRIKCSLLCEKRQIFKRQKPMESLWIFASNASILSNQLIPVRESEDEWVRLTKRWFPSVFSRCLISRANIVPKEKIVFISSIKTHSYTSGQKSSPTLPSLFFCVTIFYIKFLIG